MKRKRLSDSATQATSVADDGFLGKADPTLLAAVLAELNDELDFRDGKIPNQVDPPEPRALTHAEWPTRDYVMVQRWRHRMMEKFNADPGMIENLYKDDPVRFICHWVDIYEPRNAGRGLPTRFPFVLFKRQEELIQFYHACVVEEGNGLVEKSRDMGATWCGVGYSVWMWKFIPGSAIGWGSADSTKLDRLGDASSIFEKIRMVVRGLPPIFKPKKYKEENLMFKRVVNPDNGSSIVGEIGDNIGRGGRTRVYFVDEAAYLEHPDAVEGSLSENTRVRIDISSVSAPGTVFHRTRQAGVEWYPGREVSTERSNVFLLDWRDHPEKNAEWAAKRKASFEAKGLGHIYAREIGRDYAAVTEGAVIKQEWFDAACDANEKLGITMDEGDTYGGLDVADGGENANACAIKQGQTVKALKTWNVRDTAITARMAVGLCQSFLPCVLNYDCLGVGSGVKAECFRLADENLFPKDLTLVPWNAGGTVLNPFDRIVPNDEQSMMLRDYYANLKAQAWDHVGKLFYNTWRAVTNQEKFPVDELICIETKSIEIALLHKLRDELCQVKATTAKSAKMKLMIVKAVHDRQSPNLADAVVIASWPMPTDPIGSLSTFIAPMVIRA